MHLLEIYAKVFHTEDALVRPIIVNGTHALSLTVQGLVRPGDEILSITSAPYDTLQGVIGIREEKGCLKEYGVTYSQLDFREDGNIDIDGIEAKINDRTKKEYGVTYSQLDFREDGNIDIDGIEAKINDRTKLVMIQRSKGYEWRKSLSIEDIEEAVKEVRRVKPEVISVRF